MGPPAPLCPLKYRCAGDSNSFGKSKDCVVAKAGWGILAGGFLRILFLSFEVQLCAALQNREALSLFKHFRTNTVVNIKIKTFLFI